MSDFLPTVEVKLESASGQLHSPPANSFISGLSLLPIILHLIPRHVSVWLVLCQSPAGILSEQTEALN